jgi:hypothetical protein
VVIALSNIVNIIATPTEVLQKIKTNPKWIPSFCFITIVSIICGYFILPFSQRIMIETLSSKLDTEQIQKAISISERFKYIGFLFVPFVLLFKWSFITLLLYFGGILLNAQEINFKTVFSIVVYSEYIVSFMGIINLLLLYIKGVDSINNVTDLQVIVGLDYFLTDKLHNIPFYTFLNSFNVFSMWYITTLTIGISIVTSFSKLKSAILVLSIWLFGVGVQVALAMVSANIQHISGQ